MKPFIQDGHILALRAVRATLGEATVPMIVEAIETTDWASATFVGARHRLDIRLEGGEDTVAHAVERLVRDLPEADVATNHHFLADAAVTGFDLALGGAATCAVVTIEALTIEA